MLRITGKTKHIMGFSRKNCSIFSRGNTNLAGLANHLNQVYCMIGETRCIKNTVQLEFCTPLYNYLVFYIVGFV